MPVKSLKRVLMMTTSAPKILLCALLLLTAPATARRTPTQVRVVDIHAHDTHAFTEGLLIHDGALLESTGLNQQSFIREYALPRKGAAVAATPTKEFALDASIFGEGITVLGDSLYSLTYHGNKVLRLARDDLTLQSEAPLATSTGEGWGMTTDGEFLVVSDGSALLQFFDPKRDFALHRNVTVHTADGTPVTNINELEYVEGEVLANVWFRNCVLRIDPTSGLIIEDIDFSWLPSLVSNLHTEPLVSDTRWRKEAVMNGIAYDGDTGHVYVTGKLWDSLFELEFSYLDRHLMHNGYLP